jgi:hypothetical protein
MSAVGMIGDLGRCGGSGGSGTAPSPAPPSPMTIVTHSAFYTTAGAPFETVVSSIESIFVSRGPEFKSRRSDKYFQAVPNVRWSPSGPLWRGGVRSLPSGGTASYSGSSSCSCCCGFSVDGYPAATASAKRRKAHAGFGETAEQVPEHVAPLVVNRAPAHASGVGDLLH